jgi:hypothetical protein
MMKQNSSRELKKKQIRHNIVVKKKTPSEEFLLYSGKRGGRKGALFALLFPICFSLPSPREIWWHTIEKSNHNFLPLLLMLSYKFQLATLKPEHQV